MSRIAAKLRSTFPSAFRALAALALLVPLVACATAPERPGPRPPQWAEPVELAGVPNLHRVEPTLYRSADPEPAGWAELERLGVRTVVSLRAFHEDEPPHPTAIDLVRIPILTWAPEDDEVARFLALATDPARRPLLVHCQHGADRTGYLVAAYRVVVQGWTKQAALEEMVSGGYGFHPIWRHLPERVMELDVAAMKRAVVAGADGTTPAPSDEHATSAPFGVRGTFGGNRRTR